MSERNVHRDFARAYWHAEKDYEHAAARGDLDKIDDTLSRKQALERGGCIVIHNPTVLP